MCVVFSPISETERFEKRRKVRKRSFSSSSSSSSCPKWEEEEEESLSLSLESVCLGAAPQKGESEAFYFFFPGEKCVSVSRPSLSLGRALKKEGRKATTRRPFYIEEEEGGGTAFTEQRSAASCKEYSGSSEPCCVVWDRGPTPILPQSFSVHPFCFHTGGGRERRATRSFAFARQKRGENSETSSRYFRGKKRLLGKNESVVLDIFPGNSSSQKNVNLARSERGVRPYVIR